MFVKSVLIYAAALWPRAISGWEFWGDLALACELIGEGDGMARGWKDIPCAISSGLLSDRETEALVIAVVLAAASRGADPKSFHEEGIPTWLWAARHASVPPWVEHALKARFRYISDTNDQFWRTFTEWGLSPE